MSKNRASKSKRKTKRDQWESEVVNTDVLVYFSMDADGDPVIEEVIAPTKGLYSDLQDTLQEAAVEADLCDCDKFELNPEVREWLELHYPDWQEFVDPDFYCLICKDLRECKTELVEAGEDVKTKIQENYPAGGEVATEGDQGAGGSVEEEETEEEGPSRIVLE